MDVPTHLRSLQALELALRTGSLKAAAERLAITPAAAGQRVKALEDYLGIALLVRGRSGLQATPALATALPHLEAAFGELHRATELLDLQRGQEFHIAAAPDFVDLWLRQRLPGYMALHPNIRLSVNGDGGAPQHDGRIDCEILFGLTDSPLRDGRKVDVLFRDFVLPISSPELDARVADRPVAERLEGFALFHVDFYKEDPRVPRWPQWVAGEGHRRTSPERGIHFTRISQAIEVVSEGAGYAMCGIALARERLEANELSLPFALASGHWTSHSFQVHFRPEALQRPQVRRFRQWLLEEAQATERWLLSRVAAH